jgi:catechol 2,3-dioxygenase-like lactoylglutathione lyase family enzyme
MNLLLPAGMIAALLAPQGQAQTALPAPGFHHIHLNSVDPDAAIAFYTRQFPSTMKSSFAGLPALKAGKVFVLFTKVSAAPPTQPQTAMWHFGWRVLDVHKSLALFQQRKEVHLVPMFTTDEGGSVFVSSDTWPGYGDTFGRTKAQIADAKAKGMQPTHGAGFGFIEAPDGALIEFNGNDTVEHLNHVHLFEQDPFCARLWYEQHLSGKPTSTAGPAPLTAANCKVPRPERSWVSLERGGMLRQLAGVTFDDIQVIWHVQQHDETPLAPSRGHVMDHFALSVANLDAWMAKLRHEGVKFLTKPYGLGDTRAVMIEGPSREAIELVEMK